MEIPLSPKKIRDINKISMLKSAVYSARIEGNPLTLYDVLDLILKTKQEKLFNTIKNQNHAVPFDFIRKQFRKIPERTLRYNLKRLVDLTLVVKIGKTKGSYYLKQE